MRGIVISLPLSPSSSQLPLNDITSSPYTIRLIDGSIHKVSPEYYESIISEQPTSAHRIRFPSWLGNSQKVMYLHDGLYKKGLMEWDLDKSLWRFSQHRHNGVELLGIDLPDFCQNFQQYIDDGTLIPGWHGGQNFRIAGQARHISAFTLKCLIPPGSVTKALYHHNPD
jgi:hypothetical protein